MKENIARIKDNIRISAAKSGRDVSDIILLAVSKTRTIAEIEAVKEIGITNFGENKVQELRNKISAVENVQWHMIGSLQSNKVKYIIDKIALLHSLDRISLASEIEKRVAALGLILPVLIQVNVSGEASKAGISPNEVKDFCDALALYEHIHVKGLMTMAPYCSNPEEVRDVFKGLRIIKESLASKVSQRISLEHLSMGMSNDYQVAIEEGATIIRLGSAIFGNRK